MLRLFVPVLAFRASKVGFYCYFYKFAGLCGIGEKTIGDTNEPPSRARQSLRSLNLILNPQIRLLFDKPYQPIIELAMSL
jgi:hypothetical protein